MNAALPIPFPRLPKVLSALLWELVWKNRVVFPALAVFLALGAGLAAATLQADPAVWWASYARGIAVVAFFASILLTFAPFTLMDNHGSWRMNSVTSRWSILPVRTWWLVGVPLLAACAWMALLVAAWTPVLNRLFPGIDMPYMLAVFSAGVVAAQALAWAIPRKPSQYWALAALLFLVVFLTAIMPQDRLGASEFRDTLSIRLMLTSVGLAGLALWAAQRNRCGDWPGEIPLGNLWDRLRLPSAGAGPFRSPVAALFTSEVSPSLRAFVGSWLVVALLIAGFGAWSMVQRRPGFPVNWTLIFLGMVIEALPNVGVIWLLGWGLFLGCEPGMGFATRLSGYRGTRPLTVGTLAGTRVACIVLAWLCVWVPLLILQRTWLQDGPDLRRQLGDDITRQITQLMAGRMLFSATTVVGALPVLLWGRWEGFPSLFLATLVAWAGGWAMISFAHEDPAPVWLARALAALLFIKIVAAAEVLARSHWRGYIRWKFAASLLGGWALVVIGIVWLFPDWQPGRLENVLAVALLTPLLRFALCPLAMAANRHA